MTGILPDRAGVTVKMKDGLQLCDLSYMLQVINGIVQVSLPLFVKVDQSGGTCKDNHKWMDELKYLIIKTRMSLFCKFLHSLKQLPTIESNVVSIS